LVHLFDDEDEAEVIEAELQAAVSHEEGEEE
jgi:hypothetical protein